MDLSTDPIEQLNTQELAGLRSEMANERTIMASIRTYLALLRTGLAIAGGGTLIVSILGEGWPEWVVFLLSAVFVVIGYAIMIWGLQQYHQVMALVEDSVSVQVPSIRVLTVLTVVLQLAIVVVLVLFLLS